MVLRKTCSKLWRRTISEVVEELPLLRKKWWLLLFGAVLQYMHGVASRTAHYFHRPAPPLHDMGFALLPELGEEYFVVSELLFWVVFAPFLIWTFHPFFCRMKRFYTVLLWTKVLTVLVICQTLRVLSFTATQLPGPALHCREGSASAYASFNSWRDFFLLHPTKGCGDLIFSSHLTFTLTAVVTFTRYKISRPLRLLLWCCVVAQSLLIIASRKHYTVDVVVAWYVVPLVYHFVESKMSSITGAQMLASTPVLVDAYTSLPHQRGKDHEDEENSLDIVVEDSNGLERPQKFSYKVFPVTM